MIYIYQADVWCDKCGNALCEQLEPPEHPEDESSYDSDEYPKAGPDDEEADCPQHCAAGEDCLDAVTLPSGQKVGAILGGLTIEGVDYVRRFGTEVANLWRQHFGELGYDFSDREDDQDEWDDPDDNLND